MLYMVCFLSIHEIAFANSSPLHQGHTRGLADSMAYCTNGQYVHPDTIGTMLQYNLL